MDRETARTATLQRKSVMVVVLASTVMMQTEMRWFFGFQTPFLKCTSPRPLVALTNQQARGPKRIVLGTMSRPLLLLATRRTWQRTSRQQLGTLSVRTFGESPWCFAVGGSSFFVFEFSLGIPFCLPKSYSKDLRANWMMLMLHVILPLFFSSVFRWSRASR